MIKVVCMMKKTAAKLTFCLPSSAIGKKWEAAGPSDRYFYEVSEHSEANLKIENVGCCFL